MTTWRGSTASPFKLRRRGEARDGDTAGADGDGLRAAVLGDGGVGPGVADVQQRSGADPPVTLSDVSPAGRARTVSVAHLPGCVRAAGRHPRRGEGARDAAVEARGRVRRFRRAAAAPRRRAGDRAELDRGRRAGRRSCEASGSARVPGRLEAGSARSRARDGRGVHGAGARQRRLSLLPDPHELPGGPLGHQGRVRAGRPQARPSHPLVHRHRVGGRGARSRRSRPWLLVLRRPGLLAGRRSQRLGAGHPAAGGGTRRRHAAAEGLDRRAPDALQQQRDREPHRSDAHGPATSPPTRSRSASAGSRS